MAGTVTAGADQIYLQFLDRFLHRTSQGGEFFFFFFFFFDWDYYSYPCFSAPNLSALFVSLFICFLEMTVFGSHFISILLV